MSSFFFLMIVFSLFCLVDVVIAVKAFRRGGETGNALGTACLGAVVVNVSYLLSLFTRDHLTYSVLSSFYFSGIDFCLISLVVLNWFFVHPDGKWRFGLGYRLLCAYGAFDILMFLINPIWELSIGYEFSGNAIPCFTYVMHPLYWLHLAYSYVLVGVVLVELIRKSLSAPRIYARQYIYSVVALAAVVLVNGAYLYAPDLLGEECMDFSLLGYSALAFSYYWFCYKYSTHGLLNHFHSWIFENIDQGLVLFDYDGKLMLHNRRAEQMLPASVLEKRMSTERFLQGCGVRFVPELLQSSCSFQCFVEGSPLRCDYSVHLDRKARRLASLFVFTNVSTQFDLLTGFHTWVDFKENASKLVNASGQGQIVVTLDINSLRDINNVYGRTTGDRALQRLAEEMRQQFPAGTVFTRSREASVAAITGSLSREEAERIVAGIQQRLQSGEGLGCSIQVQSSVSVRGGEDVADTIRRNLQSMRTKKLMDKTSVHSELLGSLLQALSQCDPDTGEHVQRTQRSGEELGRRINLSDSDQSNLALLAIMHDIGKIGIPLEILNKPGKLNDAEWAMMKTHVQKGYQIAKSSKELSEIADMILYHHERWDGRGYPSGLQGEQIPLLSRIISVVDAYDAMTNDRAYRKALAESAARSELLRGAGTQFDPVIVREFLEMLEENDRRQGVTVTAMSQNVPKAEPGRSGVALPSHPASENIRELACSVYTLDPQFHITQVDDRFEAVTGYSRMDVADGKLTQLSLIFPEDTQAYLSRIRPDGREVDLYLRHRLRRKDGSAIWVNCYGHDFYDSAVGANRTRVVIVDSDDPFGEKQGSTA